MLRRSFVPESTRSRICLQTTLEMQQQPEQNQPHAHVVHSIVCCVKPVRTEACYLSMAIGIHPSTDTTRFSQFYYKAPSLWEKISQVENSRYSGATRWRYFCKNPETFLLTAFCSKLRASKMDPVLLTALCLAPPSEPHVQGNHHVSTASAQLQPEHRAVPGNLPDAQNSLSPTWLVWTRLPGQPLCVIS